MKPKSFTTQSLNIAPPKKDPHNALDFPIYESVAFEFDSAEDIAANFRGELIAHTYSRTSNPTVEYFETKITALSGAYKSLALASGMNAISAAILAVCKNGDNVIAWKNLFGHSYALLSQTIKDFGIETQFADFTQIATIEPLINSNTRAIFFETVTNPQLEIADIEALTKLAHKHNLVVIADSTITPPLVFDAKAMQVDISVMSTTKFISGGATSFGGVILDNGIFDWSKIPALDSYHQKFGKDAFIAKLRKNIYRNMGTCMTAHTAHFQILGLDLLELRFERCYENCMKLTQFLETHPKVIATNYPGNSNSPFYALAKSQFSGKPGAIITLDLSNQEACYAFMNRLKIIRRATNLNDNKSLIIHPWSTIYSEFSDTQKTEMNIRSTMMRLSVGIEGIDDLIEDISNALG